MPNPLPPPPAIVFLMATLVAPLQAGQPNTSISGESHSMMPSQEQLLVARVTALETQLAQMKSDMKALQSHVHVFYAPRMATTYMSIHDLASAMQPHSNTPTTQYYVPLYLSPNGEPAVSGARGLTSTPTSAP
jgi:hypothetical protein